MMDAARTLRRAVMIGLAVATLTIGSTLTRPAAIASASVLPDSHVGAPDVGYPSGGCGMSCLLGSVPPASGDVGYPCPGGACGAMDVISPVPPGDVGYPGCPSTCVQDQSDNTPPEPDAVVADSAKDPLNPGGWGDGTGAN
jgi:hypothetical protein